MQKGNVYPVSAMEGRPDQRTTPPPSPPPAHADFSAKTWLGLAQNPASGAGALIHPVPCNLPLSPWGLLVAALSRASEIP